MDGLVVKNSCCASRGSGFRSQHQHDGSQSSLTLVPGDPAASAMASVCGILASGGKGMKKGQIPIEMKVQSHGVL